MTASCGHGENLPCWLRPLADNVAALTPDVLPPFSWPPASGGRASAVLVVFAEGADGPDVLVIERAAELRRHAGQVAFPGGVIEGGDSGPVAAALREAAEETGLRADSVDVFGALPELWIERTRFRITPVLGWWHSPSRVAPADPREVASVMRIPLDELADPAHRVRARHPSGGEGPAFRVRGLLVWGFTAGLLDWLLRLGGWELPWDSTVVDPGG